MKPTTQAIWDFYGDLIFEQSLKSIVDDHSTFVQNETSLNEAFSHYLYCKSAILGSITRGNFDDVTYSRRLAILNRLEQIRDLVNSFLNGPQDLVDVKNEQLRMLVDDILALRELLDRGNITPEGFGFHDFAAEARIFAESREQYQSMLNEISNIRDQKETAKGLIAELQESIKEIKATIKSVGQSSSEITKTQERVAQMSDSVNQFYHDIESKILAINRVHTNTKEIDKTLDNTDTRIAEILKKSEEDAEVHKTKLSDKFNKTIEEAKEEINSTYVEIDDLEKEVKVLLRGANAAKLEEAFHEIKEKLKTSNWGWLVGIIITTICLAIVSAIIVVGNVDLGVPPMTIGKENGFLAAKILVSIPFIYLDYFFISQYNQCRRLIEKYAFKATIARSLVAYNEMIKDNEHVEAALKFVVASIDKIYESPFKEEKLAKKHRDLVNKVVDKTLENADNIIKKATEKVID